MQQKSTIAPGLKRSLNRRFSLTLIGVVTVILVFFSGLVGWYNHSRKEAELRRQLDLALKLAETSLPEAVWQLDDRSINDILRAILTNDAIMYARVLVEERVVANQVKPGMEGKSLADYQESSSFLVSSAEISRDGYQVGSLQLVMSRDAIYREIVSTTLSVIGLLIMLIIAILITSILILRHYIFKPLAMLEKSAKLVAAGNLDTPIDIGANDEIGSLAAAFEMMTVHLKESFQNLEEKVRERTVDLSRAKLAAEETSRNLAVVGADLQALLDNSPVGIMFVDNNLVVKRVNTEMEKITGYKSAELIGKTSRILYATGEAYEALVSKAGPILKKLGYCERRLTLQRKDGAEIICQMRGRFIPADGGLEGVVWSVEDITSRIRMENELLKARKRESVSVLAGGIAHDFNNILFAVIGNLSLAERLAQDGSPVIEYIQAAQKASIRAKDLTVKLMTFASGGDPVKATASLPELVRYAAGFVLSGSNVKCSFTEPDDLWQVSMDKDQISQVIQALVQNADQSMPNGGTIVIGFANRELGDEEVPGLYPGRYVQVSLTDKGQGIERENIDRIFDPYFSTKEKDSNKGSGLSLAIVHSIIHKHEGRISVESIPGEGTTFTLYLPALAHAGLPVPENSPILPRGKGMVLVMDDDRDIQLMVAEMLAHMGYTTRSVYDGWEAIEAYRQTREEGGRYVAVIMDLTIPGGMGGREAVVELLKIDPLVKVIATSGYSNDPVLLEYRDYGFHDIIAKPYQLLELNRVMTSVVEGNAAPVDSASGE
jgi:PAS domain S-box-containing protein